MKFIIVGDWEKLDKNVILIVGDCVEIMWMVCSQFLFIYNIKIRSFMIGGPFCDIYFYNITSQNGPMSPYIHF